MQLCDINAIYEYGFTLRNIKMEIAIKIWHNSSLVDSLRLEPG